eukprot:6207162-Pleurochrysis_carterae.AAC.6
MSSSEKGRNSRSVAEARTANSCAAPPPQATTKTSHVESAKPLSPSPTVKPSSFDPVHAPVTPSAFLSIARRGWTLAQRSCTAIIETWAGEWRCAGDSWGVLGDMWEIHGASAETPLLAWSCSRPRRKYADLLWRCPHEPTCPRLSLVLYSLRFKNRKRSLQLVNCRLRPQYASCPARQSCVKLVVFRRLCNENITCTIFVFLDNLARPLPMDLRVAVAQGSAGAR